MVVFSDYGVLIRKYKLRYITCGVDANKLGHVKKPATYVEPTFDQYTFVFFQKLFVNPWSGLVLYSDNHIFVSINRRHIVLCLFLVQIYKSISKV